MKKQETKIKQLTQEELIQLKSVKQSYDNIKVEFGEIALLESNLNQRKSKAQEYLSQLKLTESQLHKNLLEKYGSGNINIDTGVIS